ncbi:MAG TPA: hypothetical protein VGB19_03765 [Actinomycetota bacterium]
MGEKGNPLATMSDIPDYIASLSAAYTVYKDTQARKEDRAEREAERAQIAEMEAEHTEHDETSAPAVSPTVEAPPAPLPPPGPGPAAPPPPPAP